MILAQDEAVSSFSIYVGAGAIRFYLPVDVLLTNDNVSQTVVVAKDLKARDALKARLEAAFKTDFADMTARATPLELGPPVGWPFKYRVTSPDVGEVRDHAMRLANVLATDPAARDVNLSTGEPQEAVRVVIDQTEACALGLSSPDVASALAAIYAGFLVTTLRDGTRLVDVVLRAEDAARNDLQTLAQLQIPLGGTRSIPLSQVAGASVAALSDTGKDGRKGSGQIPASDRPSLKPGLCTTAARIAPVHHDLDEPAHRTLEYRACRKLGPTPRQEERHAGSDRFRVFARNHRPQPAGEVGASLTPGGSALCAVVRKMSADKVLDRLASFQHSGTVIQTSLSPEMDEKLKTFVEWKTADTTSPKGQA